MAYPDDDRSAEVRNRIARERNGLSGGAMAAIIAAVLFIGLGAVMYGMSDKMTASNPAPTTTGQGVPAPAPGPAPAPKAQ